MAKKPVLTAEGKRLAVRAMAAVAAEAADDAERRAWGERILRMTDAELDADNAAFEQRQQRAELQLIGEGKVTRQAN